MCHVNEIIKHLTLSMGVGNVFCTFSSTSCKDSVVMRIITMDCENCKTEKRKKIGWINKKKNDNEKKNTKTYCDRTNFLVYT
jgi:hypothetical protein